MKVRALMASDIPALEEMAKASGFPYPELTGKPLEAFRVVVGEDDKPIMAAAAKRLVELYLFCGSGGPFMKLEALRLLHADMADI